MLKRIIVIAGKNIRLRFMSPSEWLFFLVLPIAFAFLIGGGLGSPEQESRVVLLVIDRDGSTLAQELVTALEETGIVAPQVLAQDQAEVRFEEGDASALLAIPQGFGNDLHAGESVSLDLRRGDDEEAADLAERAVARAVNHVSRPLSVAAGSVTAIEARLPLKDAVEREAVFDQQLSAARSVLAESPSRIEVTLPEAANRQEDAVDGFDAAAQASSGQMVTWVFIPLLGISGVFAYERTQGTLRRLLVTPTSKGSFLLGTIAGEVVPALVQMTLLLTFGALVMDVDWGSSVAGLSVLLVAFSLASVAIGTFMGSLVKSEGQAVSMSIASGMVMALLGGCWYPAELFPAAVRTVTKVLPTTWVMQGLTDLVMRGQGLAGILPEAGVLAGFAVVFFLLGLWRFRYE